MNTEQERELFHTFLGFAPARMEDGGYADPDVCEDWRIWQARAALQSQSTEAFPCRIVEADFETGTVTLEMHGKYTVSSGQKYLCDAPPQSQDREDTARIEFLEKEWFYRNTEGVWSFVFNELWDAGQHDSLRAAIDRARRVEEAK